MIAEIAKYAAYISSIAAAIVLIVRPIRDHLFGLQQIKEGQKCLLRDAMTRSYYEHATAKMMSKDEYENFEFCYAAYTELGGNSFIRKLHKDIQEWNII